MADASALSQIAIRQPRVALLCCTTATPAAQLHVAGIMRDSFGVALPCASTRTSNGEIDMIWQEPERWLVRVSPGADATIAAALGNRDDLLVVDFSHGIVLFEISGPRCRDMLARMVPLDLDTHVFGFDAAAATLLHHTDIWLWRRGENVFEIACERSFAEHLLHHLVDAARAHGVECSEPQPAAGESRTR